MRAYAVTVSVSLALFLVVIRQLQTLGLASNLGASLAPGSKVLIFTAHPDDECMFFGPTIISLVAKGFDIVALCLSTGDSDGLGQQRRQEIYDSYSVLGVHKVHVLDDPLFKDSITNEWSTVSVANTLEDYLNRHNIDIVFTFDMFGVSGHPNHISLHKGATRLATITQSRSQSQSQSQSQSPLHSPITIMSLITTPLLTKYSGPITPVLSYFSSFFHSTISSDRHANTRTQFISSFSGYLTALRAMRMHYSQLVWFRWLYVCFSRYMWVNEYVVVTMTQTRMETQ